MAELDRFDYLFIIWAFFFQTVLIIHFAVRKRFFESYTAKYGWLVYALCIPAAVISVIILLGGKDWTYWLGGFLFVVYGVYGYWIDFVKQIQFRNPLRLSIVFPYVFLYLATVMFYWWPLYPLSLTLWIIYGVMYVIAMVLNIKSH